MVLVVHQPILTDGGPPAYLGSRQEGKEGYTAMDIAKKYGKKDVVDILSGRV